VDDVQSQVITTPVQVQGLDNVMAISAGSSNPAVVRSDGAVWTWGYNSSLAMQGKNVLFPPTKVEGFNKIIDVSTDSGYVIALKDDGTVWSWGNNYYGCLGNSSAGSWTFNVFQVTGLNDVIAIDSGVTNCIALKEDGTVWTWGYNSMGEIGDGSTKKRPIPVMTSLKNIKSIYAGNIQTAFAIGERSTVWAWGGDEYGQLGDGSSGKEHEMNKTTPINELKITAPVIIYQEKGTTVSPTTLHTIVSVAQGSPTSPIDTTPSSNVSISAQGGLLASWAIVLLTIVLSMALYSFIRKKE
jgi:alpha-tubulin suppressor-like RCC1 family protein